MKFGTIITTEKYRNGDKFFHEKVYEERVQIMKISDFDTIVEDMHLQHALNEGYGAWVEKHSDGKMYVVKRWLVKEK